MKIIVKVKPSSKEDQISKVSEGVYVVSVRAPARDGKANAAVIKILADHFGVNRAYVEIISGAMTKTKVVTIHI